MGSETHHEILQRSIRNLSTLLECRHEPPSWPFSSFDFGQRDGEKQAHALANWVFNLDNLVTCIRQPNRLSLDSPGLPILTKTFFLATGADGWGAMVKPASLLSLAALLAKLV
jgi:hypothetical protein